MKQFEYKKVKLDSELEILNREGTEGWEAICCLNGYILLKRELIEVNDNISSYKTSDIYYEESSYRFTDEYFKVNRPKNKSNSGVFKSTRYWLDSKGRKIVELFGGDRVNEYWLKKVE